LSQKYYYKRIIFVDRDCKKNTLILNKIIIILQLVANINYLFAQNFDLYLLDSQKIFLIKNKITRFKSTIINLSKLKLLKRKKQNRKNILK